MATSLPRRDGEIKLSPEGWDEFQQHERDYAAWLDQQKRERAALEIFARLAWPTAEVQCTCRGGNPPCCVCIVEELLRPKLPAPRYTELELSSVPF